MNHKLFLTLITIFLGCSTIFPTLNYQSRLDFLISFGKLYGYVKYFHPSDEAASIDWDKFSVLGVERILKVTDQKELKQELLSLFLPIAPSLQIIGVNEEASPFQFDLTREIDDMQTVFWQHQGLSYYQNSIGDTYKSTRVNAHVTDPPFFDHTVVVGEVVTKQIGNGLKCVMPLALYRNDSETLPKANLSDFNTLKKQLDALGIIDLSGDNLYVRLGNIVNVWNVYQHFFPYLKYLELDWETVFQNYLERAIKDTNQVDFLWTLRSFVAKTKDGHGYVSLEGYPDYYVPPIGWEVIEGKLVITNHFYPAEGIENGDVVLEVNGMPALSYLESFKGYSSASTEWLLNVRAELRALSGLENSLISLKTFTKDKTIKQLTLKRTNPSVALRFNEKEVLRKISDEILYLNFNKIPATYFENNIEDILSSKVIICDMRERPGEGAYKFIPYLLEAPDTSGSWMWVPRIVYPDQKQLVGHRKSGWKLSTKKPRITAKLFFIIGNQTLSYGESITGFINHYRLGTLVGSPTAGTNGNINSFDLPGGYQVFWTGMLAFKHDGRKHYGAGFLPDIPIEKTIEDVQLGRDGILEKTIKVAEEYLENIE